MKKEVPDNSPDAGAHGWCTPARASRSRHQGGLQGSPNQFLGGHSRHPVGPSGQTEIRAAPCVGLDVAAIHLYRRAAEEGKRLGLLVGFHENGLQGDRHNQGARDVIDELNRGWCRRTVCHVEDPNSHSLHDGRPFPRGMMTELLRRLDSAMNSLVTKAQGRV